MAVVLPAVTDDLIATTIEHARIRRDVFLQLTPALARRDQEAAQLGTGPLAGIPLAVKDVFDIAGTRTTAASQVRDRCPPARLDATSVHRLRAAGMVVVGKTTLSELAYSGLGHNERFGTPLITRAGDSFLVGGSSSGSAAAVEAGIVPVALASDTSGSARIPAAWAGVFGFRPSVGRYSTAGMLSLAPTLDTVGVIARDPALLRAVDGVLAESPSASTSPMPATVEFIIPAESQLASCEPSVLADYADLVDRLRATGIRIAQHQVDSLDIVDRLHAENLPIVESEALSRFGASLARRPESFTAAVQRRLSRARQRSATRSVNPLYRSMRSLRSSFAEEVNGRLLLTPPVEISPPTLSYATSSAEIEDELNSRALRTTMNLSYLGAPSAVVPVDTRRTRTGLLISGPAGSDRRVLAASEIVDRALNKSS